MLRTETRANKSTNKSANKPVNKPANKPVNKPENKQTNKSANKSTNRPENNIIGPQSEPTTNKPKNEGSENKSCRTPVGKEPVIEPSRDKSVAVVSSIPPQSVRDVQSSPRRVETPETWTETWTQISSASSFSLPLGSDPSVLAASPDTELAPEERFRGREGRERVSRERLDFRLRTELFDDAFDTNALDDSFEEPLYEPVDASVYASVDEPAAKLNDALGCNEAEAVVTSNKNQHVVKPVLIEPVEQLGPLDEVLEKEFAEPFDATFDSPTVNRGRDAFDESDEDIDLILTENDLVDFNRPFEFECTDSHSSGRPNRDHRGPRCAENEHHLFGDSTNDCEWPDWSGRSVLARLERPRRENDARVARRPPQQRPQQRQQQRPQQYPPQLRQPLRSAQQTQQQLQSGEEKRRRDPRNEVSTFGAGGRVNAGRGDNEDGGEDCRASKVGADRADDGTVKISVRERESYSGKSVAAGVGTRGLDWDSGYQGSTNRSKQQPQNQQLRRSDRVQRRLYEKQQYSSRAQERHQPRQQQSQPPPSSPPPPSRRAPVSRLRQQNDRGSGAKTNNTNKANNANNANDTNYANDMGIGRGDQVDRKLVDAILGLGFVEKHSLDRLLPLFNVATNISTKIGYDKFCFLLLLRRVRIPASDTIDVADASIKLVTAARQHSTTRNALRLFAVRVFRDEDAQKVRDMCEPVRDAVLRRVFGGAFGSYADRINYNDSPDDVLRSELDGDSLPDFLAKMARRTVRADGETEEETLLRPLLHFPNVYVYIIDPLGRFERSLTETERNPRSKQVVLRDLFAARDKYESTLRARYTPEFVEREEKVLEFLFLKSLPNAKREQAQKPPVDVENDDGQLDRSHKVSHEDIGTLVNNSLTYWQDRLNKQSSSTEDKVTNANTTTAQALSNDLSILSGLSSFAQVEQSERLERLKRTEHANHLTRRKNSDRTQSSKAEFATSTKSSTPEHQEFCDYARQMRANGRLNFLFLQNESHHSRNFLEVAYGDGQSGETPSTTSSVARRTANAEYLVAWKQCLRHVDSRLFDDARLDDEYPIVEDDATQSASFTAMAASCFQSVALQVFLMRNKLNDIGRFIAINEDQRAYRRELDVAKNFASFIDYSVFFNATSLREKCPQLFEEKIFLPLEWLHNDLVTDALNLWSHSRLDFHFCPREPFERLRYITLHGSDRNEMMRRWSEYVDSTFRDGRLQSQDRCSTAASKSRYVTPGDFARFLRTNKQGGGATAAGSDSASDTSSVSGDSGSTLVPGAPTPAASPFFDIFVRKRPRELDYEASLFRDDSKRVKVVPTVWVVALGGQLYHDDTVKDNHLINLYCCTKFPRNANGFSLWRPQLAETVAAVTAAAVENTRITKGSLKYVEALLSMWRKDDLVTAFAPGCEKAVTTAATSTNSAATTNTADSSVGTNRTAAATTGTTAEMIKRIAKSAKENANAAEAAEIREKMDVDTTEDTDPTRAARGGVQPYPNFSERTFTNDPYDPYSAFLLDYSNDGPPSHSIEQLLFLQVFLRCGDADFSILVNGNPGSGKTTVMNFLNDLMDNQTLNLLPTNVLRERTKMRFERLNASQATRTSSTRTNSTGTISVNNTICANGTGGTNVNASNESEVSAASRALAAIRPIGGFGGSVGADPVNSNRNGGRDGKSDDGKNRNHRNDRRDDNSNNADQLVARTTNVVSTMRPRKQMPLVLTLSSFIKRNLQYKMAPDMYSRIIERYLAEQLERMLVTVRPMSMSESLNLLGSPVKELLYPPLVQIDEYNLCNFAEMELVSQICRTLHCVRVCYGDFAQGAPIRGTGDNAELIALRASLMIQFMDNKRLLATTEAEDERRVVRLSELLSDPVWNWRGNNCEDGITQYVRKLIDRCICSPLRARIERDETAPAAKLRATIGDECLSERTIHLDEAGIDRWFRATTDLMNWYDERPCRRYVNSSETLVELAARVEALPLPCVISRRNFESDRVNRLVSTAIREYVDRACSDMAVRATHNQPRSAFLPTSFYLEMRRSCISLESCAESNSSFIRPATENEEATADLHPSQLGQPHGLTKCDSLINDDPWCSGLTLVIGAVYRFIGKWPEVLSTDSLLRLIAFLPNECDEQTGRVRRGGATGSSAKKKSPRQYACDGSTDCDADCKTLQEQQRLMQKMTGSRGSTTRIATLGCGATSNKRSRFRAPFLLMRRVNTRDDDDRNRPVVPSDFVLIGRSSFKLTRCNSLWTPNMYTLNCARSGMTLFGYPLVLNCGISSWRVQGETIPRSDVYVDLRNMSRQQALVSLSRVRHHTQMRGLINLRFYGGGDERGFDIASAEERD